jgi:hypothetical protein
VISEDLPAFAELVASLASIEPDEAAGESDDLMELEALTLSLAIELAVRDEDAGPPLVRGSTPTQWTETTVMPAFHRLTLHVAVEERDA